jgi:hypothetical protein
LADIEQRIKVKIDEIGIPLKDWDILINRGIVTGFNEAFIISGEKKNDLITKDPKSAELIRPILRGRDIKRYGYQFADLYVICTFPSRNYDIEDFPAIKNHLLTFGYERLEQSGKSYIVNGERISARKKTNNKWFETQDSISYWDDFSKQKIIYAETMRVHKSVESDRFPRFGYSIDGIYLDKTCFMITGPNLFYILPILNSNLMNFIIKQNIAVMDTGGYLMQKIYIERLPVPNADIDIQKKIESLALQIVDNRKKNLRTYQLEEEIDAIVYDIFGFSKEEIAFITSEKPIT